MNALDARKQTKLSAEIKKQVIPDQDKVDKCLAEVHQIIERYANNGHYFFQSGMFGHYPNEVIEEVIKQLKKDGYDADYGISKLLYVCWDGVGETIEKTGAFIFYVVGCLAVFYIAYLFLK